MEQYAKIQLRGKVAQTNITKVASQWLVRFSLCVCKLFKNSEGINIANTDWYPCRYWADSENEAYRIANGQVLSIDGNPTTRHYIASDGLERGYLEVEVTDIK